MPVVRAPQPISRAITDCYLQPASLRESAQVDSSSALINCRFGSLWKLLGASNRCKRYITKQLVHSHFMPMVVSKAPNQHRASLGIVTTTSWIVHQRVSRETRSKCFYTLNPFSEQRICIVSSCLERRPFTHLRRRDLVEGTELRSNLLIPFFRYRPKLAVSCSRPGRLDSSPSRRYSIH